jgi:hypothetical protein
MTTEEKLAQAEADIGSLIHRARNALPTLFYIIEDTKDWRRDVRATIHRNLLDAVEEAEHHQIRRKHNQNESPSSYEERLPS